MPICSNDSIVTKSNYLKNEIQRTKIIIHEGWALALVCNVMKHNLHGSSKTWSKSKLQDLINVNTILIVTTRDFTTIYEYYHL